MVDTAAQLENLSESQLRELSAQLLVQLASKDREIVYRQTKIDKLTHEIATLKRNQFGKRSEQLAASIAACWMRRWMRPGCHPLVSRSVRTPRCREDDFFCLSQHMAN